MPPSRLRRFGGQGRLLTLVARATSANYGAVRAALAQLCGLFGVENLTDLAGKRLGREWFL